PVTLRPNVYLQRFIRWSNVLYAGEGGHHVGCNFTHPLVVRSHCGIARWSNREGDRLWSDSRHCYWHCRGFDRELVATPFGHPPRLRTCSRYHRRYHRRDYSAAHPQTGLPAREVVTAQSPWDLSRVVLPHSVPR